MSKKQRRIADECRRLVRLMVGHSRPTLTEDEAAEAREADPDLYKQYLKQRRLFNGVWKEALAELADGYEDDVVPMGVLLDYLKSKNIDHHLPKGFDGWVDKNGKWHVGKGVPRLLPIDGVPSGYVFPRVKMNPKWPESPWVFQAFKADGTPGNYFYTREFKAKSRKRKFENVRSLIDTMDELREGWWGVINEFEPDDPRCVAAVILELLYLFSARVGSVGNGTRHGVKTYGIATLCVKHCRVAENAVTLSYRGKDGVKTKHTLVAECRGEFHLLRCIRLLWKNKRPGDPLFTYRLKDGRHKPVRPYVVNALFKELGAGDCTIHKLRTYHATKMALEQIEAVKAKRKSFRTAKACHSELSKIAERVGRRLNHVRRTKEGRQRVTGHTALAAYIDASAQADFYTHYGVDFPPRLQKLLS